MVKVAPSLILLYNSAVLTNLLNIFFAQCCFATWCLSRRWGFPRGRAASAQPGETTSGDDNDDNDDNDNDDDNQDPKESWWHLQWERYSDLRQRSGPVILSSDWSMLVIMASHWPKMLASDWSRSSSNSSSQWLGSRSWTSWPGTGSSTP